MKVLRTERAMEPCIEGGFFGHYVTLDGAVSAGWVEALAALGSLTFMKNLKKPFYLVRGPRFVIRGQVGDSFCKLGIEGNDGALLEKVCRDLEALPEHPL